MSIKKKRIAIVINSSWYGWMMRANLGFALKKRGYEVIFISPYDKYSEKLITNFNYTNVNISSKGKNPLEDLILIYKLFKLYKKLKPDIICHFNIKPNIYGTIAGKFLKIPCINNIAGLGQLFIKQNFFTILAKFLYRITQKSAAKVFFQNKEDLCFFINEKLVEKNKTDLLPGSGVDINKFLPIKKKENNSFVFILISRLIWAKGIQEFVDAAKIINTNYSNVKFQLVGPLKDNDPTAISIKDMKILFKGNFIEYLGQSDDVRIEIGNADCVVLPSFYREGTPRILLESASMGKPIITTDNVGCRNVVDDGINGFLCKKKDFKDLANKMEKILNLTNKQRKDMGKAGREKMKNEFDEKIVINKYLRSIEKY